MVCQTEREACCISPEIQDVYPFITGGAYMSNTVMASSRRHNRVSVGHLRDWSAGNEIICDMPNAHPACSVQLDSGAPTGIQILQPPP